MASVESAIPVAATSSPLSKEELRRMNAYWRAANYLSVGQIYLYDNPLLRDPLKIDHVKPRLLGHWGTTPGLNFIYVHCNRLIKKLELNMIYITGPGHGGPGLVANTYLEGTYSEYYPNIPQNEAGAKRCSRFSFRGIRATSRRRRRDRSAEGGNWDTAWRTRMARHSIIRTCWSVWSDARPETGRWRRAGIRTSS